MEKVKTITKQVYSDVKKPSHKRTIAAVIVAAVVIAALPLTVFVAQQQQDNRQNAAAAGGFSQATTNGCGEVISAPAIGAETGNIVWKAPVKATDGTWQTVKQDGTIISQDEIEEKYLNDPRNGGTIEEREENWQTVVGLEHINCNVFINFTNGADCEVEFQGAGSTDTPLAAGGTTTLVTTAGSTPQSAGCRKLIHVVSDGSTTSPTPSTGPGTITPTPTTAPTFCATDADCSTGYTCPAVTCPTGLACDRVCQPVITPTATPSGTVTPIVTEVPTPTLVPAAFTFGTNPLLNGISGAIAPLHTQRFAEVTLLTPSGTQVAIGNGTLAYDATTQRFIGNLGLAAVPAAGQYLVKITTPQYLTRLLPLPVTIASGSASLALPQFTLIAGDANNDNKIDILDYNMIYSCYGPKANKTQCTTKNAVDFDDNALINGIDYNIYLKNLATHEGD